MIRNDQLPFDSAFEMIEKRHQSPAVPAPERPRTQDKVYNQRLIHELEARVAMLEEKNSRLKRYLKEKDRMIMRLQRRVDRGNDPNHSVVEHKEQRIRQFSKELKGSARLLRHQEKELSRRDEFIAKLSKGVLVKKLANLGQQEFSDKKFLDIKADDILLVDDINQRSQSVLDELKGKVRVIMTAEIPKKPEQGFIFLRKEGLIVDESENYAIADKKALDEELRRKELLRSVVDEYRKERVREKDI
jgi:predicted RNase H-like nuclease (RuvC/YqgF family)